MLAQLWRGAVKGLLHAAEVPSAQVAAALGVNRGMLHQWLDTDDSSNQRNPNPNRVRQINQIVADRVKIAEVSDYLYAAAAIDGFLDYSSDDMTRVVAAGNAVLASLDECFVATVDEMVLHLFRTDKQAALSFIIALTIARGKAITAQLSAKAFKPVVFIDEVVWLARRAGFDLDLWIRNDKPFQLRRVHERAGLVIDGHLAKVAMKSATRVELGRAIRKALLDAQAETLEIANREALVRRILDDAPSPKRKRRR